MVRRTGFLWIVVVASLAIAACGGGDDDASSEPSDATGEQSTTSSGDDGDDDEADDGGVDEGAPYIAALTENLIDPDLGVDRDAAECTAAAVVDAVGVDVLVDAGDPEEVAAAPSLAELGVDVDDAMIDDLAEAFDGCIDFGPMVDVFMSELFAGVPDALRECVAGQTAGLMPRITAQVLGAGDDATAVLTDLFDDMTQAGGECAEAAVDDLDLADQSLTLDAGRDTYVGAVATRLGTPVFEGAPAMSAREAECAASAVVDTLGESALAEAAVPARDLAEYTFALTTPEDLGLSVDDATATQLADAYLACVDVAAVMKASMETSFGPVADSLGLDDAAFEALLACLTDSDLFEPALLRELYILQFRLGSAIAQDPSMQEYIARSAEIGQQCALQAAGG